MSNVYKTTIPYEKLNYKMVCLIAFYNKREK